MSPNCVIFLLLVNLVLCLCHVSTTTTTDSSTNGINIPYINAKTACDPDLQPQIESNFHFGYLDSPTFSYMKNLSQFNCTWLIQVQANQTMKCNVEYYKLAGSLNADFYDGHSVHSPLIASYNGSMKPAYFQTKTNQLFIHYYGSSKLAYLISIVHTYIKESPPTVLCPNNTIRCHDGFGCVELSKKCDGLFECQDGTDEEDCPRTNVTFSKKCGQKNEPLVNELYIVGGKASVPASWPWMVSLRRVKEEPNGHTCGASVLNRKWILTAAHCMAYFPNIKEWTVNVGKYQKLARDRTEVIRYIKRKVVHEHFLGTDEQSENSNLTWYDYNANDIALIELNAPLPDDHPAIGAICLANESFQIKEGLMSYVIGWGSTQRTGNDLVLKEAVVPVISNTKCHTWMPDYNVGPKMLCAGYEQGGQDSCQGDSGGPLFAFNPNSSRYDQIGIVSTGDRCAAKKEAGIYTRVPSFISWIKNVTSAIFEE